MVTKVKSSDDDISEILKPIIKNMSFNPTQPKGGETKNKQWAYTDAQWKELFDACKPIKTAYRNELCNLYFCSYQTVRAKNNDKPTTPRKPVTTRATQSPDDLRESINAEIAEHQEAIAMLNDQLDKMDSVEKFLADPAMLELIKKMKV